LCYHIAGARETPRGVDRPVRSQEGPLAIVQHQRCASSRLCGEDKNPLLCGNCSSGNDLGVVMRLAGSMVDLVAATGYSTCNNQSGVLVGPSYLHGRRCFL